MANTTTAQRAGWQPFTVAAVRWTDDGVWCVMEVAAVGWLTLSAVSLAEAGVPSPQVGDVGMCYVRWPAEPLLGQTILALTLGEALLWDKRDAGDERGEGGTRR